MNTVRERQDRIRGRISIPDGIVNIRSRRLRKVKKHKTDGLVWGALASILRVCRAAGLAPLSFVKVPNGWRVSVSPVLCICGYLFVCVINAAAIAGLIYDFSLPAERSVRVRSSTAIFAWVAELTIVILVTNVAIIGAPTRMRAIIECSNIIERINSTKISLLRSSSSTERNRFLLGAIYLVTVTMLHISDYYIFWEDAINEDRDRRVIGIYCSVYVMFVIILMVQIEFVFVALYIINALNYINESLNDLIYIVDLQSNIKLTNEEIYTDTSMNAEPVNLITDTMEILDNHINSSTPLTSKATVDTVRRLIFSYGSVSDMVRKINETYGTLLLLLLGSLFLHLVITPYYLVAFLLSPRSRTVNVILEVLYCIFHTVNMVLMIEPGHRTETEFDRTQMLVSQLTRRVTSCRDPLARELNFFYKQITMNAVNYKPMGVCTMTRPLTATIIGAVSTYMVILLQFQALDKQNW